MSLFKLPENNTKFKMVRQLVDGWLDTKLPIRIEQENIGLSRIYFEKNSITIFSDKSHCRSFKFKKLI